MAPIKWHGRYFETACPFHDAGDHMSFLVYDNGAICLSASCQRRASLSQVYAKVMHINPNITASVKPVRVVDWYNQPDPEELCMTAHEYLLSMPEQGHYLRQRGLEDRIEPQQLGWWFGWITVPMFDDRQRFIGMILRATPTMQTFHNVRYITPPNQPNLLYVPDWPLVARSDYVFVTFGIFDALALTALREPAVSPSRLTGIPGDMFSLLRKRLIVVPDRGEEVTARRLVSSLDWRGEILELRYAPGMKDPADYSAAGKTKQLARLLHP